MKGALFAAVALSLLGLFACGATTSQKPGEPPIARTWRSRCGACHTRVEPGARTRPQLEHALARHHKRVKMNDVDWVAMIDFLAADRPAPAPADAAAPVAD